MTDYIKFSLNTQNVAAAASTTSGSTIVGLANVYCDEVIVKSPSTNPIIYIVSGNADNPPVATSKSHPIMPGEIGTFRKPVGDNQVAVLAASSTGTLYILAGSGN